MLKLIKITHTLVWAIFASAIFYVLYAGITKTINVALWISIALVLFEVITLLINKWTCPLTPIAKKYTDERQDNFDIYLPAWLARHNKTIFSVLFFVGLALVVMNLFSKN